MNADPSELNKFSESAHAWWDLTGEFKALHDINPLRLGFISGHADLAGARVLDVGCGGGILAEALARSGAHVTAIDLSEASLSVARLHLLESGARVDYRLIAAEALAEAEPASYDVVTCLEMLEHVPEPRSIVDACARLVKPGGNVFFSTLSRTPKAYLFAVLGAEYFLRLLPRGTHDYAKFIKPSELATFARRARLEPTDVRGLAYQPLTKTYSLNQDASVNYLMHCHRP